MKRRATWLLALAAVIFVVARILETRYGFGFWMGALRATAEASMVGGLADWFAVTALFRHPLGIPIPHTAVVAKRKDRVGRSLGMFVQRNFLSRQVIETRLRERPLPRKRPFCVYRLAGANPYCRNKSSKLNWLS